MQCPLLIKRSDSENNQEPRDGQKDDEERDMVVLGKGSLHLGKMRALVILGERMWLDIASASTKLALCVPIYGHKQSSTLQPPAYVL